ncbi:MAG TPA: PDZ domain-containing protein, partial [Vicinamibacterales bacterium]|nr:PDZ domain-containing protein [Vicinamibacterales bacterium]
MTGSRNQPSRLIAWGRSLFALLVVGMLLVLGVANIALRAQSRQVEDGVLWVDRAEGVTVAEIADGSPAARSGLQRGDVLLAVNGVPVERRGEVFDIQHRSPAGTTLSYTVVRLGSRQVMQVELAPGPQGSSMYFVLAAVGLFTLLVGASVRLRRPDDQATLHFFWLCVAFFGAFTFSFTGPLDRLDWIFYWGDAIAMALMPALLLHFTLEFPERPAGVGPKLTLIAPLIYAPAVALGIARVVLVVRGASDGPAFSHAIDLIERGEHIYLFVAAIAALGVLVKAFHQITSETAQRQLRWIAWGTGLGVGPFALFYALPWALGTNPPLALQLTAIPLGVVPLTFASAIVRYRLRDVEVIIKRAVAYAAFLSAAALLYFFALRTTGYFFGNDFDQHNWIVALLATLVVVLVAQPVRQAVQEALDRVFYRDRYDYRRALLGFARDLNSDLDVVRLSRRLVSRIVETLGVDKMALMLGDEQSGDFASIGDFGFRGAVPALSNNSSLVARLGDGNTVALDDPLAAALFSAEDVEFWRDAGIDYFVPCMFEGGAIAVLALGRKDTD